MSIEEHGTQPATVICPTTSNACPIDCPFGSEVRRLATSPRTGLLKGLLTRLSPSARAVRIMGIFNQARMRGNDCAAERRPSH